MREPVRHPQEGGAGGHRPPGTVRRRYRPTAPGDTARGGRAARPRRHRRLRPGRTGGGGGSGALRRRGHRVRGAARGRRRAALRHPGVPAAPRHHRARGAAAPRHGRGVRDQQGDRPHLHGARPAGRDGVRCGLHRCRRRCACLPRHPRRVRRPSLFRQRVPDPRQPDGRRPVPLSGHAGGDRRQRRRHRRRQHRHGLPADGEAAGRRDGALRLSPLGGGGAGARRGTAPRPRGGDRLLLPACARGDPRHRQRRRPGAARRTDGTGRAGRARPAPAGGHRRDRGPGVRHGDLRARHQGQSDRRPVDPGHGAERLGLHRRR